MSDEEYFESEFHYPELDNEAYEPFFVSLNLRSFWNAHMPYNKKLTDFQCSGCTGKYIKPQFDIFPQSPYSQSVSYYLSMQRIDSIAFP
jgi:hypothetical protein